MSIACKKCKALNPDSAAFCKKCGFPLEAQPLHLEGVQVGNYRLLSRIGGGGFGEVYRAEHAELGNPFAVKILHPRLAQDPQFVERFRHEAIVLAGLQHENVVQVVDFGHKEDVGFYLVMEWLEGRSLHRVWRQKRVLPEGKIYALFSQLLDALQLAHDRGIVHRDMKPENLMLIQGSRRRTILKIVDFGIATILSGSQKPNDPLNKRGIAIGTPYYMAPEQALGQLHKIDHRSDIYACGIILTELLTGRRVFRGKTAKDILRQQIEKRPPRLHELNPNKNYPPSYQEVIDKALAKRRKDRYNSASEFFHALKHAMDAAGIQPIEEDDDNSSSSPDLLANLISSDSLSAPLNTSSSFNSAPSLNTSSSFNSATSLADTHPSTLPPPSHKNLKHLPRALLIGTTLTLLILLALGLSLFSHDAPSSHHDKQPLAFLKQQHSPSLPPQKRTSLPPQKRLPKNATMPPLKRTMAPKPRKKLKYYSLYLITSPPKARIYVNRRYRGKTPKKIYIIRGMRVKIRLWKKGYIVKKFIWRAKRSERKKFTLIEELF